MISLALIANLALAIWSGVVCSVADEAVERTFRRVRRFIVVAYPTFVARPVHCALLRLDRLLLVPGTPGASCSVSL